MARAMMAWEKEEVEEEKVKVKVKARCCDDGCMWVGVGGYMCVCI